jgi:hypothetical protein
MLYQRAGNEDIGKNICFFHSYILEPVIFALYADGA